VIQIDIADEQDALPIDRDLIAQAVQTALRQQNIAEADVSVAIVDNPTIRQLHRQYLAIDEPTDVMSFVLERSDEGLEGEVVASAERAVEVADQYGWTPAEELLLYVVHGTLHLAGHDDATAQQRAAMREQERACLAQLGLEARYDGTAAMRKPS